MCFTKKIVDFFSKITSQPLSETFHKLKIGDQPMNVKKVIKPADVDDYHALKRLAQQLCDEPNNVDGILMVCTTAEEPILLDTCTEENFQGIDTKALASRILGVIKFSDDLVISHKDFSPGEIKSIVYEFDNLAFVIYNVRSDASNVYLVLINAKDKDLGAFNINRGRIRAQMEVGFKKSGIATIL